MSVRGLSIRLKLYALTIGGVGGTIITIAVFFLLMQHSTGALSGALKKTVSEDTRLFELIHDVAVTQGLLQQINREQDAEKIESLVAKYASTIALADKRIMRDFSDEKAPSRQVWAQLKSVNQSILDLVLKGQQAMALQKIASDSNPLFEKLLYEIDSHRQETTRVQAATLAKTSESVRSTLIVFVSVILIVYIGLFFFGLYMSRSITLNIRKTVEMLQLIAQGQGDLTKRLHVESKDEVGELAQWFNKFVEYLEEVIIRVKNTAVHMDTSTQEVAAGAQGLSQATQEQASAIEEVAATIEEMTSSIKHNAENASDGRQKANEMVRMANMSGESAQELVKAMTEISNSSKKIGDIIVTVNEVAFQTNLLALNAAVEAARAGEHGKGFAVVAEEVRALAQRSADAAKQIKVLIEDTVNKISAGDIMVKKSGESLTLIIKHIQDLSQVMEEIAAASSEQASGVDEVNRAVAQIDTTTQQNASTVEELASTSDNLSNEAQELASTVSRFKVSQEEQEFKGKKGAEKNQPKLKAERKVSSAHAVMDDFEEF
jgi:methyl-accepting chemotaxis protein